LERRGNSVTKPQSCADPVNLAWEFRSRQARYIEAGVNGVLITSIYLPNGNPQPGPKFNYKLKWFERLMTHATELIATGVPVVLAGDYNVLPTPQFIQRDPWTTMH
jgi:exodeoxyribonuclease III